MSAWNELQLDEKIDELLAAVDSNGHHLGRPYLCAYQIAVELERHHPETVAELQLPAGGAGNSANTSLPQYIARMLSQRVLREGSGCSIEGAFLSSRSLREMTFSRPGGRTIRSSVTSGGGNLSMFRIRE